MPTLTSKFNLPDIVNLPDLVLDPGFSYNEMTDLQPVTCKIHHRPVGVRGFAGKPAQRIDELLAGEIELQFD